MSPRNVRCCWRLLHATDSECTRIQCTRARTFYHDALTDNCDAFFSLCLRVCLQHDTCYFEDRCQNNDDNNQNATRLELTNTYISVQCTAGRVLHTKVSASVFLFRLIFQTTLCPRVHGCATAGAIHTDRHLGVKTLLLLLWLLNGLGVLTAAIP